MYFVQQCTTRSQKANNEICFLWAGKVEVQVPGAGQGIFHAEASPSLGLEAAAISLCAHMTSPLCEQRERSELSGVSSCKDTNPTRLGIHL